MLPLQRWKVAPAKGLTPLALTPLDLERRATPSDALPRACITLCVCQTLVWPVGLRRCESCIAAPPPSIVGHLCNGGTAFPFSCAILTPTLRLPRHLTHGVGQGPGHQTLASCSHRVHMSPCNHTVHAAMLSAHGVRAGALLSTTIPAVHFTCTCPCLLLSVFLAPLFPLLTD